MKRFSIRCVLEATKSTKAYEFFDGHPVDMRSKKYNRWRELYLSDQLRCKMCGSEAAFMKLVPCKSSGHIHKKTGLVKHTFMLYDENGIELTFDHWVPKSFLKRKRLEFKARNNLVIMCKTCNKFKSDTVPHNWQDCYQRMSAAVT